MPAGRWRVRPGTVRAKIVCLLMVPVVSLLALWASATVTTAQDVARLRQLQRVDSQVRAPVAAAVAALQAERLVAVRHATDPGAVPGSDLRALRGAYRPGGGETAPRRPQHRRRRRGTARRRRGPAGDLRRRRRTTAHAADLGTRTPYRVGRDVREVHRDHLDSLRGRRSAHRHPGRRTRLRRARTARILPRGGGLGPGGRRPRRGAARRGPRRQEAEAVHRSRRHPTHPCRSRRFRSARPGTKRLAGPRDRQRLRLSGRRRRQGAGARPGARAIAAVPEATWTRAHARVQGGMRAIEADAGRDVADRADPFTRGLLSPAGAAVLLGLAAVAASLVISVRIGRGLVVELVSLRNRALEIARQTPAGHAEVARRRGDRHPGRGTPWPARRGRDRTGRGGTRHRAPRRPARRRGTCGAGQRHLRGFRQPRAPQPDPRPPPTEPPRQHGAQVRRPERTQ